jgi:phytoene dehydrogenase-like protein
MRSGNSSRIVIVGAGMAGLTAGAYLLRAGHGVLILEKTSACGGLVGSFRKEGFLFDTGPRAIGNAGILVPMLEDLNINLPMIKGEVSTGIQGYIVHYNSNADIDDFVISLRKLFPEASDEINRIDGYIRTYTRMAETLNKVANPFFKNIPQDWRYLFKELIPWLPSFLSVVLRTGLFRKSVEEVLGTVTSNQSLIDMVSQHFFKGTPANFAFGYFENYQDYKYPLGGTGELPKSLVAKIISDGGIIQNDTEVTGIYPAKKMLTDQTGEEYAYDMLLWAADLKSLYRSIDCGQCPSKLQHSILKEKEKYLSVNTGESVFTVFLALDEAPEVFKNISKGHFIYTPKLKGLGDIHRKQLERIKAEFAETTKKELFKWLKDFCLYNSYEISIPVLKDVSLAPENKTGLVISLLIDGELFEMVEKAGWYDEFREKTVEYMLDTLQQSIYPGLKDKILFMKSSTPVTLRKMFNTANGAITGWSLEEESPVPGSLAGVMGTAKTAIPNVFKAGQWSYSPSGVPIAILTGRIAADVIQRKARSL